jgi:arginyl-tRNA--protein-N-Asp/Glu arginylyltransferase
LQKNAGIKTTITKPEFVEEHFALYRKYIATRHTGGGMDDPSEDKYIEFLTSVWAETEFVEFRLREQLVALAVMDILPNGLSSVYTYFDPDHARLSLGRHALLWQIKEAKRRHLPYLYLGYWIKDCQKMFYKQEYRPIELYQNNRWSCFDRQQELAPSTNP